MHAHALPQASVAPLPAAKPEQVVVHAPAPHVWVMLMHDWSIVHATAQLPADDGHAILAEIQAWSPPQRTVQSAPVGQLIFVL